MSQASQSEITILESWPGLTLGRFGDVAILTLARADAANAIDIPMTLAFNAAADRLTKEGWTRAILLRAEGPVFCAGGDVKGFAAILQQHDRALSEHLAELAGGLHSALEKLLALDAPLIVGVNGPAAGAGMSLVLAADLAFAGPKARLTPAYPKIGFSSDGGMTYFLPRIVGERRAAEIMLLNRTLSAQEAAALGIFISVSDQEGEAFDAEMLERAAQVAAGPRRAYGVIRRLLEHSSSTSLAEQLAAEAKGMSDLALGADVREGVTALREKRGPVFGE